nr:pentapeptide repeat-containing protein [uncultured Cohaesibacter sp.]
MTRSYILSKKKKLRSRASDRLKAQKVEIVEPTATILRKEVKRSTIWRIFELAGIVAALAGLSIAIADNRVSQESLRLAREENRQSQIVQSWQIVTTKAPGNSGKKEALERLYKTGQSLEGIDLSCEAMGGGWHERTSQSYESCDRPTILRDVSLPGTNLSKANLNGADLGNANLEGIRAEPIKAAGADLTNTNLQTAKIKWAVFDGAKFYNTNLQDTHFHQISAQHANFKTSLLHGASFQNVDFTFADLSEADFSGSTLQNLNVSSAKFCVFEQCAKGLPKDLSGKMWAWSDMRPYKIVVQKADKSSANFDINSSPFNSILVDEFQITFCAPTNRAIFEERGGIGFPYPCYAPE